MEACPQTRPHDKKIGGSVCVSCVATLSAIKRQVILDGAIKSGNWTLEVQVPDAGDYRTKIERRCNIDGTRIEPKLCDDGRTEDMKYMKKHNVFEFADEKECHDSGCNPLTLKWVDKMKDDACRSRLVCRDINKANNKDEQLGPKDVFSPMPLSEGSKMLVSTTMTGHVRNARCSVTLGRHIVRSVEGWFHEFGNFAFLCSQDGNLKGLCHGDDLSWWHDGGSCRSLGRNGAR